MADPHVDWNAAIDERIRRGERPSLVILHDGLVGIVPQHLHSGRGGPLARPILYTNYSAGGGVALANELEGAERTACSVAAMNATHAQARRDRVDKLMLFPATPRPRNLGGEPEGAGRWKAAPSTDPRARSSSSWRA